jgi:hypothetical protein
MPEIQVARDASVHDGASDSCPEGHVDQISLRPTAFTKNGFAQCRGDGVVHDQGQAIEPQFSGRIRIVRPTEMRGVEHLSTADDAGTGKRGGTSGFLHDPRSEPETTEFIPSSRLG